MVHIFQQDGKRTANINVFIDPQWGFSSPTVPSSKGGSLYVPGGEEVAPIMGDIIKNTRNGIFVLGQDYHPANHISFMANHPGIMEYRIYKYKELLAEHNQPIPDEAELYEAAQQPVHFFNGFDQPPIPFPFPEIVLGENGDIIGLKEADGRIHPVTVMTESGAKPSEKDRGRVERVYPGHLPNTFDGMRERMQNVRTQTLWTRHCEQGKDSSLYPEAMNLPKGLTDKLAGNLHAKVVSYTDPATGNQFHVVRKGTDSEIDSYGIGVENDGETLTPAWDLFKDISREMRRRGAEQVQFNVGGLATNFCTEFSINNIADFLAGHFKMKGIDTKINFVPEISRAIPIPGGPEVPFSADGAYERMRQSRGVGQITVQEILASQQPSPAISGDLHVNGQDRQR